MISEMQVGTSSQVATAPFSRIATSAFPLIVYMHSMRCIFISLSFLLLSSSIGATEGNLMKCRNLGLFLGDCSLVPTTLFPETDTERSMEVRFLYDCVGHSVEFGFQAYGFHKITPAREPQTITISGRSLKLVDNNPDSTLGSTFDFGCELRILEKKIQLSEASDTRLEL